MGVGLPKIFSGGVDSHHASQKWRAEPLTGSLSGPIKDITESLTDNAKLWVYMAKDKKLHGTLGLAWIGTFCKTNSKGYQASINEKRDNVLTTAEIVTHEIGHYINMLHDFDKEHKGKGCDGTGFMNYGTHPYEWSECSKNDFLALYRVRAK